MRKWRAGAPNCRLRAVRGVAGTLPSIDIPLKITLGEKVTRRNCFLASCRAGSWIQHELLMRVTKIIVKGLR